MWEKTRVDFKKELTETIEVYSNWEIQMTNTKGVLCDSIVKYDFVINEETYKVEMKSTYSNVKKGKTSLKEIYFYEGLEIGKTEKIVIEHILNN